METIDVIQPLLPVYIDLVDVPAPAFIDVIVIANEAPKKQRKSDYVSPYNYIGKAAIDALEADSVWLVTRLKIALDGTVEETKQAQNITWTNRLTATYL